MPLPLSALASLAGEPPSSLEKAELELRREPAGAEEREGTSCAQEWLGRGEEGKKGKRAEGQGLGKAEEEQEHSPLTTSCLPRQQSMMQPMMLP